MFGADEADLVLTVTADGRQPGEGAAAAARLMDTVTGDGGTVRMTKRRPLNTALDLRAVRERLPVIVITGLDIAPPPRAAALLGKDDLTKERLAFAIRRTVRRPR